MTSITLNIKDDSLLPSLINILKRLDFVEVGNVNKTKKVKLPKHIEKSLKQAKLAEQGKIKLRTWQEFEKTL